MTEVLGQDPSEEPTEEFEVATPEAPSLLKRAGKLLIRGLEAAGAGYGAPYRGYFAEAQGITPEDDLPPHRPEYDGPPPPSQEDDDDEEDENHIIRGRE